MKCGLTAVSRRLSRRPSGKQSSSIPQSQILCVQFLCVYPLIFRCELLSWGAAPTHYFFAGPMGGGTSGLLSVF
jgi:hypothetical protein